MALSYKAIKNKKKIWFNCFISTSVRGKVVENFFYLKKKTFLFVALCNL